MGKKNWLKRNFIPLLTLLLVIAITVGIFYFYKYHPGTVGQLKRYGYLGVFLISLTFNATLLLPAGNILILSVVGAVLPSAIVVGLVGGAGGSYIGGNPTSSDCIVGCTSYRGSFGDSACC